VIGELGATCSHQEALITAFQPHRVIDTLFHATILAQVFLSVTVQVHQLADVNL
jgi:hypothetical protein